MVDLIYWEVDEANVITAVSNGWVRFADENGGAGLQQVVGKPVSSFITDPGVATLYKALLNNVRLDACRRISYLYRCDSPDTERTFRMVIERLPDEKTVRFLSIPMEVPSGIPGSTEERETFHICPHCEWLEVDDEWVDPIEALSGVEVLRYCNHFRLEAKACGGRGHCRSGS